uniref:Uncharacterized protein n=1 Tax=Arundo donax TaxID=35708 RepID=A0A0A9BH49_ARUDO
MSVPKLLYVIDVVRELPTFSFKLTSMVLEAFKIQNTDHPSIKFMCIHERIRYGFRCEIILFREKHMTRQPTRRVKT